MLDSPYTWIILAMLIAGACSFAVCYCDSEIDALFQEVWNEELGCYDFPEVSTQQMHALRLASDSAAIGGVIGVVLCSVACAAAIIGV